jgi:hypothetical protein
MRGALTRAFDVGSRIVEVTATTFFLKSDDRAGVYQLMRYNGGASDAAVVDDVVELGFEYAGDPDEGGPGPPVALSAADVAGNPPPPVRRVEVRIRVQAATDSLRGPAGALFMHGGPARHPSRWVPDLETTVVVSLRNSGVTRF